MTTLQLQCLLKYLGYDPGCIDGVMGENTRSALKEMQTDAKITVDGIPGANTETALLIMVKNNKFKNKTKEDKSDEGWWKNIVYFRKLEFACPCGRCGGFPKEMDKSLILLADDIRKEVGRPMIVSSGVRCRAHNAELSGSVPNSKHLEGKAMDFCITGLSAQETLAIVKKRKQIKYAYAIDSGFVHMNV